MKNYEVIQGKKGQKQVRFWPHPKVMPVNMKDVREAMAAEFPGVDEGEIWFVSGFVNFWMERKTDGTLDTEG